MKTFKDKLFIQFIKFGIVGVSNTAISYFSYVISLYSIDYFFPDNRYDYFISQTISFIAGVLWSFYWNNKKVFRMNENEKRSTSVSLLKSFIMYGFTGLLLSSLLLYVWIDLLGISKYLAPIFNLILTVPLNFILSKYWVFKTKPDC